MAPATGWTPATRACFPARRWTWRSYFADGFGGVDLLADTLQAWFAECWWKAGGWAWPIPLWLHVHDGFGDGRGIALTERC